MAARDGHKPIGYQTPMDPKPLILLAAGGTGGHLFPAEALGAELMKRGFDVRLVTDSRALRYRGLFSTDMIEVVASETARGRNPLQLAHATLTLATGVVTALSVMRRLKPKAVVGFGGYPTLPPPRWPMRRWSIQGRCGCSWSAAARARA